MLFQATLRCGDIDLPVQLRNLSESGAMIANDALPFAGAWLALRRKETLVRGRLVWPADGKAGLRFEAPIPVDGLLRKLPEPRRTYPHRSQRPRITGARLQRWEQEGLEYWAHLHLPTADGY